MSTKEKFGRCASCDRIVPVLIVWGDPVANRHYIWKGGDIECKGSLVRVVGGEPDHIATPKVKVTRQHLEQGSLFT